MSKTAKKKAKRTNRRELTETLGYELVLKGFEESLQSPYGMTCVFTEITDMAQHIERLRKAMANIKRAGYIRASVEVSCEYEDETVVTVTGTRLETDEEFDARKLSEKKMAKHRKRQAELRAQRKEEKERIEYARLKAKAKEEGWDA